jgi:hypothetical protein
MGTTVDEILVEADRQEDAGAWERAAWLRLVAAPWRPYHAEGGWTVTAWERSAAAGEEPFLFRDVWDYVGGKREPTFVPNAPSCGGITASLKGTRAAPGGQVFWFGGGGWRGNRPPWWRPEELRRAVEDAGAEALRRALARRNGRRFTGEAGE